jgi:hypothetical protein
MNSKHEHEVKMDFPKWLFIPFTLGLIVLALACILYALKLTRSGLSLLGLLKVGFLFIIVLCGIWCIFRVLFYSVTATKRGLETNNLLGKGKLFLWDEIVEVRRPRFRIPADFVYVISRDNYKLPLIKSMKNYGELIQLIQAKASNLQNLNPNKT